MRPLILFALLVLGLPATAQTPGACALGTAQNDLATPDLLARLFNTGSLFFGGTTTNGDGYLVPRAAAKSPLFAAGLWVGGKVDGEIRVAGGRYTNFSFWPGPLDAGAALPNPADCSAYDRIYVVSPADVAAYEATGVASPDLAAWPVGLGSQAVDAGGQPVVASSRGQVVDLAAGERPVLHGGPTAFWVMNDVGGPHTAINSDPLGIEVRVTAFAVDAAFGERPVALRQSTVIRYEIVNRNTRTIRDLHAGFFMDPDLGNATDDYIGADSTRSLGFVYNADNNDTGLTGYDVPPAFGVDALTGLGASVFFEGLPTGPTTDPDDGEEMYHFLRGRWGDRTPMRARGNGYGDQGGAPVTRFAFPGDPVTEQAWSEVNNDGTGTNNAPGDRRHMHAAPAVTLAPGASTTFDLALLFAWGEDHLGSVTALRALSDATQALYDAGHLFGPPPPAAPLAAPALVAPADGAVVGDTDVTLAWEPVPGAERYVVEVSRRPGFEAADATVVDGTSFVFAAGRLPLNNPVGLHWRVRAMTDGREGPASTEWSFRGGRYEAGPMRLASGAFAFVETTAPGGAPACDGPADPDEGCAEVGGDLVASSDNSTADYQLVVGSGTAAALAASGTREIEIRFTAAGSIGLRDAIGPFRRVMRAPFEVWDIGTVAPGEANDPSDDRQMIALLGPSGSPVPCTVGYGSTGAYGAIGAAYAFGDDYAAFDAAARALIDAAPDGCPTGTTVAPLYDFVDESRERPLASVSLRQVSDVPLDGLAGSTIRLYSADPPLVSTDGAPTATALALAPPRPNPAAGRVALPYRMDAAGHVRLTVVDALGRTVATLADGAVAAGEHTATLDARRLAPGVYAVVLDADGRRAVRRLTIAR